MKHTDIKVLVVGCAATGKSAIVDEITAALNGIGIETVAKHLDQEPCDDQSIQDRKIGRLIERGTKVEVVEVHATRSGSVPAQVDHAFITFHRWYTGIYGTRVDLKHYQEMETAWRAAREQV